MSDRRPRDEDVDALLAELAATLDELSDQVDGSPGGREQLLRFTEQYAIPTAVAMLEANIRVLEAVRGAIRISQGRDGGRDADREATLGALDRALDEVTDAVRATPTDPDARQLLSEARTLRGEIRARVEESPRRPDRDRRQSPGETTDRDGGGGTHIPVSEADGGSGVDIDAELETIREEVEREEE